MTPAYLDFLRDVVITIHMNVRELQERKNFADQEELTHIDGKLQAYQEVLSILKYSANEFGVPGEEVGL